MAINIDTQDVDNYPGTIKRVVVDQDQIVPTGFEGDEQFVITVGTSAYSDNTSRTAIQDVYIMDFVVGWAKSSGLVGTGGKYTIDSTHNQMKVKLDSTISGSDGNGYYEITLDTNTAALTGEQIAEDMELKIRALPTGGSWETADAGYALAYSNCSVEYKDGKFWILSGSIGRYYTGSYKTSVTVASGTTNDCMATLGFDLGLTSENYSGILRPEALVTADYTADTSPVSIATGTGVTAGDVLMITDGYHTDYFKALSGTTATSVVVDTGGDGISHNYKANGSKVQILRAGDPDDKPRPYFNDVDSIIRYGVKAIVNQIDYSS